MRLLIAEEDAALAGFLRRGMEAEGYQVQVASSGRAALDAIYAESPDLAILDLNMDQTPLQTVAAGAYPAFASGVGEMPQLNGADVLRRLRASGARFPVLVLTGGSDLESRLACLDQGADDCMFKPFSLQELRARCRALLRRSARSADPLVQVQDLTLNRMERVAERGGRRIKLTNREYGLLEQLVLERGRCVSRSMLLERVWGLSSSETNVIDVYINYLRRKLGDTGPVHLIETVRGKGYRISMATQGLGFEPVAEPLPGRGTGLARA